LVKYSQCLLLAILTFSSFVLLTQVERRAILGRTLYDQTSFTVRGDLGNDSIDWTVYDPSIWPRTSTTTDIVQLNVWLRIVSKAPLGPHPVDVTCTVDGILISNVISIVIGTSPKLVSSTTRTYSVGIHTAIWAVDPNSKYSDPNSANNKVTFEFTVGPASRLACYFLLDVSPSTQTVAAGQVTTFNVTVNVISCQAWRTKLFVTGLPTGATAIFNPDQDIPTFSSNLKITTTSDIPAGTYALNVTGSGGSLSKTTTIMLTIQNTAAADFELSVIPSSQTITPQGSVSYTVSAKRNGDFKSSVNLTISGVPSGVEASFSPAFGTPDYASTLHLKATQTTPPGTCTLTIQASGGGLVKSTSVDLVIQAPTGSTSPTSTSVQETTPSLRATSGISSLLGVFAEQPFFVIIVVAVLLVIAGLTRRKHTS
jgi:hypothetical protein